MLLHPLNGLGILEGLETAHLLAPTHLPFPAVLQQQAAVDLVGPQLGAAGPHNVEAAAIVVHVSVGNDDALYRVQRMTQVFQALGQVVLRPVAAWVYDRQLLALDHVAPRRPQRGLPRLGNAQGPHLRPGRGGFVPDGHPVARIVAFLQYLRFQH